MFVSCDKNIPKRTFTRIATKVRILLRTIRTDLTLFHAASSRLNLPQTATVSFNSYQFLLIQSSTILPALTLRDGWLQLGGFFSAASLRSLDDRRMRIFSARFRRSSSSIALAARSVQSSFDSDFVGRNCDLLPVIVVSCCSVDRTRRKSWRGRDLHPYAVQPRRITSLIQCSLGFTRYASTLTSPSARIASSRCSPSSSTYRPLPWRRRMGVVCPTSIMLSAISCTFLLSKVLARLAGT